jgi:hypothetical protein
MVVVGGMLGGQTQVRRAPSPPKGRGGHTSLDKGSLGSALVRLDSICARDLSGECELVLGMKKKTVPVQLGDAAFYSAHGAQVSLSGQLRVPGLLSDNETKVLVANTHSLAPLGPDATWAPHGRLRCSISNKCNPDYT